MTRNKWKKALWLALLKKIEIILIFRVELLPFWQDLDV